MILNTLLCYADTRVSIGPPDHVRDSTCLSCEAPSLWLLLLRADEA